MRRQREVREGLARFICRRVVWNSPAFRRRRRRRRRHFRRHRREDVDDVVDDVVVDDDDDVILRVKGLALFSRHRRKRRQGRLDVGHLSVIMPVGSLAEAVERPIISMSSLSLSLSLRLSIGIWEGAFERENGREFESVVFF